MTTEEKLDALLDAVVSLAEKLGGVTALYLRDTLEHAGLIECHENPELPGNFIVTRLWKDEGAPND